MKSQHKVRIALLLCLCLCLTGLSALGEEQAADAPPLGYENWERPVFVITMQDGEQIIGELYPDIAPISVANFATLANEGFYDEVIFHRIIENFMIQGGDPTGTGTGGPGYSIVGEFSQNGIQNDILHVPGTLSMARAGDPNSGGSQFFIVQGQASPHLDGAYAAFGQVLEGMEVVDAIAALPKNASDRPLEPPVMESVRVYGFSAQE